MLVHTREEAFFLLALEGRAVGPWLRTDKVSTQLGWGIYLAEAS